MATLALPPTTKAAGQDATQEKSLAEYVLFCLAVSSQEPIYKEFRVESRIMIPWFFFSLAPNATGSGILPRTPQIRAAWSPSTCPRIRIGVCGLFFCCLGQRLLDFVSRGLFR